MVKIAKGEILKKYGEDTLNDLNENGYVILPIPTLSEEDKKCRRLPTISFIVSLNNLEN